MAAWYREWFGEDYLELYSHRDSREAERQADFVTARLEPSGDDAVLDLACGAGRHTEALRRRGLRVLGVDLSLVLLAHPPRIPSVAGDMRSLPFRHASFDLILNFFTSFGYFESERENFRVLEEIARLLVPGGSFLVDLMNRDRALATLEPRSVAETEGRRVTMERWHDPSTERINKRIRIEAPDRPPRTFLESVRAYRRDEVVFGMRWAGLEVDRLHGSFDGTDYDSETSERLIVLGRRPL